MNFLANSVEVYCWSKLYDYRGYVEYFKSRPNYKHYQMLDEQAYDGLYKVLNSYFERSTGIACE